MSWLSSILGAVGSAGGVAGRSSPSNVSVDLRHGSHAQGMPVMRVRVARYNPKKYSASNANTATSAENLDSRPMGYTDPTGGGSFPTYYFPMPQNVAVGFDASWSNTSLGSVAGNVYDMAVNGNNSAIRELVDSFTNFMTSAAAQIDTLSVFGGIAPNPNTALNFSGMELRVFSFTLKLVPLNVKHAQDIQTAIQDLRRYSLPITASSNITGGIPSIATAAGTGWLGRARATVDGTSSGELSAPVNNFYYGYPCEFFFDFLVNEAPSDYLPRSLPCALTRVTAAYGGDGESGPVLMRDGKPAEITLTLEFKETIALTREVFDSLYGVKDQGTYAGAGGTVEDFFARVQPPGQSVTGSGAAPPAYSKNNPSSPGRGDILRENNL